jgi:uncharacterized protein YjaZ
MLKIVQQCKGGTLHLVKIPKGYRRKVARTAEKAFDKAGELFAYKKPVEVVIFSASPELIIPEVGIGAHATVQGDIVMNMDFSRHDIRRIIKKELPSTVYHEFSHVVRKTVHAALYSTLLESLVTEGIASYVEKKVCKSKVPYIKPIRNEMKYWKLAQRILGKKRYSYEDHSAWFYGTKKLPRWIGYRLGYLMVAGYMKNNPKTSFAKLVRLGAKGIFKGCGKLSGT